MREGRELLERRVDGHIQHIRDAVALEMHLQGFAVEAGAVTDIAGHVNIRQELHFDAQFALALAGLAASAMHVERETAGFVAAHLAFGQFGKQPADLFEQAGVGGRVGTRRAPDRRLVDVDDLVEMFQAVNAFMFARLGMRAVQSGGQGIVEHVAHQGGFARPGDAGDADEHAERDGDGDIFSGCWHARRRW